MTGQHLFCLGLGYTGLRLARDLAAAGWSVGGTVRDPVRAATLAEAGVAAVAFDGSGPAPDLAGVTHLLSTIPPGPADDAGAAAAASAGALRWIGYVSATSVYGDRAGGWVDEDDTPRPTGAEGRRRLAAERAWRAVGDRRGVPVACFRVAAIYGPGRSAFDALRAGTARCIVKPGQVFSRVHVDDLVAVLAAAAAAEAGGVFDVADGEPASTAAVTAHAARLLGQPPPPEEPYGPETVSSAGRRFWTDNRRVRAGRIRDVLGVRLACPSYREGLALILSESSAATASSRTRSSSRDSR